MNLWIKTSMVLFLVVAVSVSSVSALTVFPTGNGVNFTVANDNGPRYDTYGDETYYMVFGGGLNAMKMTNVYTSSLPVLYETDSDSGYFYITDTGGQGRKDNAILLLGVNGTVPEGFSVTITASGYVWDDNDYANATYQAENFEETFTRDDFIYGLQDWRPPSTKNLPLYSGSSGDMDYDSQLMFIDLYTGILGYDSGKQYSGMLKVDYEFTNFDGCFATFNAYGWQYSSNQPPQIVGWANDVTSGYYVDGTA